MTPTPPGAKYWELIADGLHRAGFSWGKTSFLTAAGKTMWLLDARKGDGPRFVVHADDLLAGFLELEAAVKEKN